MKVAGYFDKVFSGHENLTYSRLLQMFIIRPVLYLRRQITMNIMVSMRTSGAVKSDNNFHKRLLQVMKSEVWLWFYVTAHWTALYVEIAVILQDTF